MKNNLIAPCGMNCRICLGYIREKNRCFGCREMCKNKPDSCRKCTIMHCNILKKNNWKFCSDKCEKYPCKRLKDLDKKYRAKYRMSMIENLESIQKLGIMKFIKNEKVKWKCKKCGNTLCVHRNFCLKCGDKR